MMGTNLATDSTNEMTPGAKAFAKSVFATLSSEYLGFKLDSLKYYLNEDLHINPDDEAKKVGYKNLQDLLESKEMKSWIHVKDEQNERGEVSRIYKAKPIGDYFNIYLEQQKAHKQKMKNKAKRKRMFERTYGVTRSAEMGNRNYGGKQDEPPNSNNYQKTNNWSSNEGQIGGEQFERNVNANFGGQSSNHQNNNVCFIWTNNSRQKQQQKSKGNQNGLLDGEDERMEASNRLSTTIHYQGLGEPAGLDDFFNDSSDDENNDENGDERNVDWMNNELWAENSNNLGTKTTTKSSIPVENNKHSINNSNQPPQSKTVNNIENVDEKGKRIRNIQNGMSSNSSFTTVKDIWSEEQSDGGEEGEDGSTLFGTEDCTDDDDDDFQMVMGDDNNVVDGRGNAAHAHHQLGVQIGQQNDGVAVYSIQNGMSKLNSSNLRQSTSINSAHQLQQQNQMMGSERKQQQIIQTNQQLEEEGRPSSITQQKDRTKNKKTQKQGMKLNGTAKTKNVPEDILVDFGSSLTHPSSSYQIVNNSNGVGQLEMGGGGNYATDNILINGTLSTTSSSNIIPIPQFELPEEECNTILHPHHFVPAECALLLCDVQEGFRQRVRFFPEIVSNISRMVKVAKLLDIQIIGTKQLNCGCGKIAVELQRFGEIPYIQKSQFSMCIPLMRRRAIPEGVKTLILCGFETHISILQSAFDFQALGFNVHLISDASSSSFTQNRLLAFRKLETCGIGLETSDCAIHLLVGNSSHQKFKAIQKIIDEHPAPDTGLTYQLPAI